MNTADQIILTVFSLAGIFLAFNIGIMIGGNKVRNGLDIVSPATIEETRGQYELTDRLLNRIVNDCKEEKRLLNQEIKVLRAGYSQLKEELNNLE